MPTTTFNIDSVTELDTDIALIDATGADATTNTAYTFNITATAALTLTSQLDAINLDAGSSLTINGNGATLDGAGQYNGLFVYAGTVTVDDLAIVDALALGGAGVGGGAGLGGGLFVASGAAVTLSGVTFHNDEAVGGAGGSVDSGVLGGGGLDGGNGAGGGGGFGLTATGGPLAGGNGGPGILFGAASGGAGSGGQGGEDGGGGGGSNGFGGGGGGSIGGIGDYADGGFGGGGSSFGRGGFGGGNGGDVGLGGGGLGAGGDIFVQQGGSLIYSGGTASGGSVAGGAPGDGGGPGSGFGAGLFLQGNQQVTLSATAAQPLTIGDVIADQTGSGGINDNVGAGTLVIAGPGTVTLSAANTYTGGTTLTGGTFDLANAKAAGSGVITFATGDLATLRIELGDAPANTIAGFAPGARIDFAGVGTETTATLSTPNEFNTDRNVLTLSGGASSVSVQLDPDASYAGDALSLIADGSGGTYVSTP
jgi:hypothetical protein